MPSTSLASMAGGFAGGAASSAGQMASSSGYAAGMTGVMAEMQSNSIKNAQMGAEMQNLNQIANNAITAGNAATQNKVQY